LAASVIVLSKNPSIYSPLRAFLESSDIDMVNAENLGQLIDDPQFLLFNPLLLIDLDDFSLSDVKKAVEMAQKQHMPFYFLAENLSKEMMDDVRVLKPSGYFAKPLDSDMVIMNIEQEIYNVSTSHLKTKKLDELFVKNGKDYERIGSDDILWIQASGNYIEIFTSNEKSYLLRIGLKDIEGRLPDEQFLRVHKSYIVNKKHIVRFNSHSIKTMRGEVPLARSYFNTVLTAFTVI